MKAPRESQLRDDTSRDHVRQAALEMIRASKVLLDRIEECIEDPDTFSDFLSRLTSLMDAAGATLVDIGDRVGDAKPTQNTNGEPLVDRYHKIPLD